MNKQKGFTLIELLVVIAIIGLLSTLAVISLGNARAKSRDAKRVADVKQIQTALELYYNDTSQYPSPAAASTFYTVGESSTNFKCIDKTNGFSGTCASSATNPVYMAKVPAAPTPNDGNCTVGSNLYSYMADSNTLPTSYTISYCLGSNGLHTATPAGIQ
jgi:prepilin-type N-terminal cleavage/methylation domain-containing protein